MVFTGLAVIAVFAVLIVAFVFSIRIQVALVEVSMAIARAKGLDPLRYREDRGIWWFAPRWFGLVEVVLRRPRGLAGVDLREAVR